nr:hypothetical protein K-LCC10_0489 [Kaumoebavirus]
MDYGGLDEYLPTEICVIIWEFKVVYEITDILEGHFARTRAILDEMITSYKRYK